MAEVPDLLDAAAESFDWDRMTAICDDYVAQLRSSPEPEPIEHWQPVLSRLRRHRRYDELLAVADALLADRVTDPRVVHAVGQSLVDRDRPATADLVFRSLLAHGLDERGSAFAEASGGVARCAKEMYLATSAEPRRWDYLREAYSRYSEVYDRAPQERFWHGINAAALLARAADDGVALPPSAAGRASADARDRLRARSREVAAAVLATVVRASGPADPGDAGQDPAEPDAWLAMTACEACVALNRYDEAVAWAQQALADQRVGAFEVASLLRQLTRVWQLRHDAPPGDRLLALLESSLLARKGGGVLLSPQAVSYEAVHGTTRFRSLQWYLTGLQRCRAVVRIEDDLEDGVGTGFLLDGRLLHPGLPSRVLVTNAHVVPDALSASRANAVFHGLDAGARATRSRGAFRVRMLWSSPWSGVDTTLLELVTASGHELGDDRQHDLGHHDLGHEPDDVTPVPVAPDLPPLNADEPPRAYVIGHPNGVASPQFSLQDNALLDYDDRVLHYRSPTEPGSSGSPVFDGRWDLVGLHHASLTDAPRLNDRGGLYSANEGITLAAIRRELEAAPPAAR